MINLDEEPGREYLDEWRENLAAIETGLLAIEAGTAELDEDLMNRSLRTVHSVRRAGFFNLVKIRELAQQAEQMLALLRSRKMAATPRRIRVLLRAIGLLHELVQRPSTSNLADITHVMDALSGVCADHYASTETHRHPAMDQAGAPQERLRVLLVEDDFTSRLALQTFLSRYGECHVAVNGIEAVDAFRLALEQGRKYDLICMDIMMPEMDGREAVRQVRALEECAGIRSTGGVKIFMTTAVDDVKEVARCFNELCDAYILKPIDHGQLLNRMKSYNLIL
jgi:two-component system chemotaxis response regulator CheY